MEITVKDKNFQKKGFLKTEIKIKLGIRVPVSILETRKIESFINELLNLKKEQ